MGLNSRIFLQITQCYENILNHVKMDDGKCNYRGRFRVLLIRSFIGSMVWLLKTILLNIQQLKL